MEYKYKCLKRKHRRASCSRKVVVGKRVQYRKRKKVKTRKRWAERRRKKKEGNHKRMARDTG